MSSSRDPSLGQRFNAGLLQIASQVTVLLGASLGLGVAVNLALAGANTALDRVGDAPFSPSGALTLAGTLLVYGVFGLIAESAVASVTAIALAEPLQRWLHLVATGHPQQPQGQSPLAAVLAHATYLAIAVVGSLAALVNGVEQHKPEWIIQAVLFIFLALVLGGGGAVPWLVALRGRPKREPVSDEVVSAGETGLIIMVATATLSIGTAMAITQWLPGAFYGGTP